MHPELKEASIKIFSGLAESYEHVLDVATFYQDRRWKDWILKRLAPGKGQVLDIGCGTLVLEERGSNLGAKFVGVDLSTEMVRLARAKNAPNVDLLANGDAEHLPFGDSTFDSVVSCYAPKYVRVDRLASEIARVLRPGAEVLLYDFARPRGPWAPLVVLYIQGGLRIASYALRLLGRGEAAAFRDLPWIIQGTSWDSEVPRAMEAQGFETIEMARLTGGAVFAYRGRRRRNNL